MNHKVEKTLLDYSMLCDNDKVVVALSGGADSVALLYTLNSLKEKYNFTLYACHLNHMIRGEEAFRDENFVKNLCESLGVELFLKREDVVKTAEKEKLSLELCGRNLRYNFFAELSQKLCAKIATAHTASDNVETVLFNVARGTSLTGLCGIKPKRDYIIRPLIMCSRQEVEQYCKENSLEFVTDSSNLTDDYTRNNIRHNCVPTLKTVNPDLCFSVSRMCSDMNDIKDFLDKISEKEIKNCKTEYGYSCKKLLKLDRAVLTNSLGIIAKRNGADVSHRHIELIVEKMSDGGCVDLPDNKRCVCKQGILRIVSECEDMKEQECPISESSYFKYISKEEIKNVNKKLLKYCISCDIITENTLVRTKREGDRFTLPQRLVTKSLKKLFNELKIPAEKRSSLLVVANNSDVLFVEGIGVSEKAKVTESEKGAYIFMGDKNE